MMSSIFKAVGMIMRSTPKRKKPACSLSRRDFLKTGMLALGGCLLPQALLGALRPSYAGDKTLSFYNIHTGEKLKAVYWTEGVYDPAALSGINQILRDYRTGDIKTIDTGLLDLLHSLQTIMGTTDEVYVISGYRSPETNARLRENDSGVAGHSLHMEGRAIDIRLPGYSIRSLHKAAVALQAGGVGYYPALEFVHVDVGRVRYW
jgi:uncharacterized protein YcbK (DUF882 family)